MLNCFPLSVKSILLSIVTQKNKLIILYQRYISFRTKWLSLAVELVLVILFSLSFIFQADSDKDGRLTLAEMIKHPYVFYSAIFDEDDTDDDYGLHDEFR